MAYGDISGVIATHEFDASHGVDPSFIHILDTLNCLAYQCVDDDGLARSIIITSAGFISEPAGNTLEFNTDYSYIPSTCLRPTDILCIAYQDAANGIQLEAIVVAPDGTFSQHANHRSLVSPGAHTHYHCIHISANVLVIVMKGPAGWGRMYAWGVSALGQVDAAQTAYFTFNTAWIEAVRIAHVGGNIYVISFQDGNTGDGYARSVNITDAGAISFTAFGAVLINPHADEMTLAKIADGLFVTVQADAANKGIASVFEISAGGSITVPTNNTYEFDAGPVAWPSIVKVTNNIFAVAYTGSGSDGELRTIRCDVASAATWTPIGTLKYDATSALANSIKHVSGNVYVVVYHQTGDPGQMATIGISTPSLEGPHHEMMMKIGP